MPLDGESFKWLTSLGVGGVLAWVMFVVHRKDTREWQSVVAAQRDAWRSQAEMLLQVVIANSSTIALNTAATKQNTEMLIVMKGEILDAFARAGHVERRSHPRGEIDESEQRRRHP